MVTIPYWFIRYGLPAGLLMLATATILAVRPALHEALPAPTRKSPPASRISHEPPRTRSARAAAYSVRSGDTLGTIADRFGTTVDRLLTLNPGIDPRGLRVGQPLRVE
jgi:LysM repeat protein